MNHLSARSISVTKNSADNQKILQTWFINPLQFMSSLKMHLIANYLRPQMIFQMVFQQPSLMVLEIREFIKNNNDNDLLKQGTKFHIKYLTSFELANFVSQSNYNKSSLESSEEQVSSLPLVIKTKIAHLEKKQKQKSSSIERDHQVAKKPGTHSREVISHYNNIKAGQNPARNQSIIYHLRNLNNWIKSMLISEYINKIRTNQQSGYALRVLDMGCGKGGDIHKYFHCKISHLICTDIAKVSLEQCQSRYRRLATEKGSQSSFTAEFFVSDCSKDRLTKHYKSPWLEHHLVSCQFALHYSFESYLQADCIISNASDCLQAGGFFIATIPNAYEIMRRLRKSHNGRSFGNELYNIEFLYDTAEQPPLFGAKYLFQLEGVVDCSEFLVHFPTLVKLCRKHGLKLDKVNTFAEYFKESFGIGEKLLRKTKGLQTVVDYERDSKENFEHVEANEKTTQRNSDSYGTLSKAEWEVATLYYVCAFKKCKTTWDKELNPIYDYDS